ncbi:MAG TPA: efflux RND transporter periplasmic adaptor subunit [Candidatus Acidoferrales bacterium]|nr:efflux RND transporter periplasmic adaptor subunit [Candidatus Acidoferrales bacterium]
MDFLRRYRVGVVVAILLITTGGFALFWTRTQQARGATRTRPDPLVSIVSPQRRDIEVKLSFTADILPIRQAAIFSKVSGYIRKIHVERGDLVKEGQLLVEIDDLELKASSEQARAAQGSAEAGLEVARSTLEGQKANLESQRANLAKARAVAANDTRQAERMKTLFEKGMVAAVEWDNARTNADSSRASTDAAEAQLRLAAVQITTQESQVRLAQAQVETYRAALSLAQTNLSNTRLLAPFPGYIAQRNLDQGAAVSAQSSGTTNTSVGILLVQDISSVKVQIEVPERDIARVAVGAPVRVTADPYKGEVFAGSIARVVHSLDPRSRTMGIEVEIPNPRAQLKPGMFARVEAVVEMRKAVLTVPLETLRVGEGPPIVMLVRSNAVEAVQVQLGAADQKDIEIVKGVSDRDQVILQGKDLVRAGQKVRTVPASSGQ